MELLNIRGTVTRTPGTGVPHAHKGLDHKYGDQYGKKWVWICERASIGIADLQVFAEPDATYPERVNVSTSEAFRNQNWCLVTPEALPGLIADILEEYNAERAIYEELLLSASRAADARAEKIIRDAAAAEATAARLEDLARLLRTAR